MLADSWIKLGEHNQCPGALLKGKLIECRNFLCYFILFGQFWMDALDMLFS